MGSVVVGEGSANPDGDFLRLHRNKLWRQSREYDNNKVLLPDCMTILRN